MEKSTFLNIEWKGWQTIVSSSSNLLLVILLKANESFWCLSKFSSYMGSGGSYYGVRTK